MTSIMIAVVNRKRVGALLLISAMIIGFSWAQAAAPAELQEERSRGIENTRLGEFRQGYSILRTWIIDHPEDIEARFFAAWGAAYLGRTYEAADLLSGLDESVPEVQFLWGKLLADKGDPLGAIEILEPLAQGKPLEMDLEIRVLLVEALMAVGRARDAVPWLEGRVGEEPALALQLALAKYESGDDQGAREVLAPFSKRALDRIGKLEGGPDQTLAARLIYEYGRLLVAAGQHQEAIDYLEAAVQVAPACKQCWQQMAQAYAASGRRPEAQIVQRRFEEIVKNEAPLEQRQRQHALDLEDPTGRALREAAMAFEGGDPTAALRVLQDEAKMRPQDPRVLHLAARILISIGQGEEAQKLANQAVQMAPGDAEGYYIRGSVLEALGEAENARRDYARVLQLAPDHRAAADALDRLPAE